MLDMGLKNGRTALVLVAMVGFTVSTLSLSRLSLNFASPYLQLGLLQVLDYSFWLGFGICLVAVLIAMRRSSEKIFIATSGLLFVLIWSIPVLVFKNPHTWDAYRHLFGVQYVTEVGRIPSLSESSSPALSYPGNMPGYFVTLSAFVVVSGADWNLLIKIYPIFAAAITFLGATVFLKRIAGLDYRFALIVTTLANVYFQFHVSPQSLGFFIALLVLVTMDREGDKRRLLLSIVLFSGLAISHPTSTFLVMAVAALGLIIRLFGATNRELLSQFSSTASYILIFLSWLFFNSPVYSGWFITAIAQNLVKIFTLQDILAAKASANLSGIFSFGPRVRLIILTSYTFLCLIYFVIAGVRKRSSGRPAEINFLPYVVAPIVLTVLDGLFYWGMGGVRDRFFLFFLMVAPTLSVKLMKAGDEIGFEAQRGMHFVSGVIHKRWRQLAGIVLLGLAVMNFSTVFYNFSLYAVSDESIEASKFVDSNTRRNVRLLGGRFIPSTHEVSNAPTTRTEELSFVYPRRSFNSPPYLLVLDSHDRIWYLATGTEEEYVFYEQLADSLNRVYDSSIYRIHAFL